MDFKNGTIPNPTEAERVISLPVNLIKWDKLNVNEKKKINIQTDIQIHVMQYTTYKNK